MARPVVSAVLLIDIPKIKEMSRKEVLVIYFKVNFLSIICILEQIVLLQNIVHVCIEGCIEFCICAGTACRLHQLRYTLGLKSFYGNPQFQPPLLW